MNAVNHFRCNIHGGVETKCEVGAVQIVINGLGQADHIQTFFRKKIRGLMCAIAAECHKAVQLQILIGLFHRRNFIHIVIFNDAHVAERRSARSEDRSAKCQNTGELRALHELRIPFDQSAISIMNTNDLAVKHFIRCTRNAANRSIQSRTVPAASKDTYTSLHQYNAS